MLHFRSARCVLIALACCVAGSVVNQTAGIAQEQEKKTWDETWTIVVYQDKKEPPGAEWKSPRTIENLVGRVREKLPAKGKTTANATAIPNNIVDEQIYATLLDALSGTLLKEVRTDDRQEWLIQFSSPPPESIALEILSEDGKKLFDKDLSRTNAKFQATQDPAPKVNYLKGKPRVSSGWTVRCQSAPTLPSMLSKNDEECSSRVVARVKCADGQDVPVKVCMKSRFNENFINRILPVRLELKNLDNDTRTKLLSAFGSVEPSPGDSGAGNPKEPMLFVPYSEAIIPDTVAGILVFGVEQEADSFFYAFVKSQNIDGSGQIPDTKSLKWYRCEPSDDKQYRKYAPRSQLAAQPPAPGAVFKEVVIKSDDPAENVMVVGKSGGKLSLRISEFNNGSRSRLGDEMANDSRLDAKWLNELFEYASKNASQ